MTSVYVLKEVESVTKIAKNIFGDIVRKVYYTEAHFNQEDMANTIAKIDRCSEHTQNTDISIDHGAMNIVIEFVNGRKVFFSNSEWGEMKKFEFDEGVVIV